METNFAYKIDDTCIFCSTCAMLCPKECIALGYEHYEIDQSECLRCGICARSCPVQAIRQIEDGKKAFAEWKAKKEISDDAST